MILKEKAWIVNKNCFSEPWFVPDDVFYAETVGKVKYKILPVLYYDNLKDIKGEDMTYLTLKVLRSPENDKYLVDDKIKKMCDIEYDKEVKERNDNLDSILKENPNGFAYIKKGGYYYRPNNNGYTEYIIEAGVYPISEAVSSVKHCSLRDNMKMIVIDKDEHNLMVENKIKELKSRII